jgi:hypothetical protein
MLNKQYICIYVCISKASVRWAPHDPLLAQTAATEGRKEWGGGEKGLECKPPTNKGNHNARDAWHCLRAMESKRVENAWWYKRKETKKAREEFRKLRGYAHRASPPFITTTSNSLLSCFAHISILWTAKKSREGSTVHSPSLKSWVVLSVGSSQLHQHTEIQAHTHTRAYMIPHLPCLFSLYR